MSLVNAQCLEKQYAVGDSIVKAIRGIDFSIEPESFVAFVGPSWSGKSTLLNMVGCLDPPTSGILEVAGRDITSFSKRDSADFRGEHVALSFRIST